MTDFYDLFLILKSLAKSGVCISHHLSNILENLEGIREDLDILADNKPAGSDRE